MVADDLVLRKRQVHLLCKEAMWAGGMHLRHHNAEPARLRVQAQLGLATCAGVQGLRNGCSARPQRAPTLCTL